MEECGFHYLDCLSELFETVIMRNIIQNKDSQIQKQQLAAYAEEKKLLLGRFERLESEKVSDVIIRWKFFFSRKLFFI